MRKEDKKNVASLLSGEQCYIVWSKEKQQWLAKVYRDNEALFLYKTAIGEGWDTLLTKYGLHQINMLIKEAYQLKGKQQ